MLSKIKQRLAADEGFTLIELLVVIVIIGVLLAIAIPSYLGFKDKAEESAAQSNVRALVPAVESFYSENDSYTGMTLTALKGMDQSIDDSAATPHKVSVPAGGATYCIQSKKGKYIASKSGPSASIVVAKTSTNVC